MANKKKLPKREMFDDPQPRNDPEFQEEMFALYQHMGMKPEDLDEEEGRLYARWLKCQP